MADDKTAQTIARVLDDCRDDLLEEWFQLQLASESIESDPFDRTELRRDSAEFLDALKKALEHTAGLDEIDGDEWRPVRKVLDTTSLKRAEAGLNASEAATFILSLKQPLSAFVRKNDPSDDLFDHLWALNGLVDQLGLYVAQVYQRSRDAVIARQQAEMIELSTPVVKIWDGILALPLIGTLDTSRSQVLTEGLLSTIAATGSRVAIIDLTGVPAVDTRMAQHLLRTAAAARLMGAECILCGITPQIAQTMVHLQIDFEGLKTESDLASALRLALRSIGLRIVARSEERHDA